MLKSPKHCHTRSYKVKEREEKKTKRKNFYKKKLSIWSKQKTKCNQIPFGIKILAIHSRKQGGSKQILQTTVIPLQCKIKRI